MAERGSGLYRTIGGTDACRKLSAAFYARVARDPVLRPLFPGKTMTCAIEAFAAFLVQFLGGPSGDSVRRWWLSLRESHLRFRIGPRERDAWMANMLAALDEVGIGEPGRQALVGLFERSSAYVMNAGESPTLDGGSMHPEIGRRWDVQLRLDEAVAAVRAGDVLKVLTLADGLRAQGCDRAVFSGLLGVMIACGDGEMMVYVRDKVTDDPALVRERYAGLTLLHRASAAGCLAVVELLLRLGADPNAADGGEHTPLYSVGNECKASGGGDVVRALVRGGAKVDARDGVKHCTALHMAARRGNVEVAEALLDCGADIEVRDSLGETPLRRAVNCNKPGVASLLLSRGADANSKGSKGLTPLLAARSSAMKQVLRGAGRSTLT